MKGKRRVALAARLEAFLDTWLGSVLHRWAFLLPLFASSLAWSGTPHASWSDHVDRVYLSSLLTGAVAAAGWQPLSRRDIVDRLSGFPLLIVAVSVVAPIFGSTQARDVVTHMTYGVGLVVGLIVVERWFRSVDAIVEAEEIRQAFVSSR